MATHHRVVAVAGDGYGTHQEWGVEQVSERHLCHVGEIRECGAGAERGQGNVGVTEFFGDSFGEGDDVGFAGVIDGHVGARLEARSRGDVHHAAAVAGDHAGEKEAGECSERGDVDLEELGDAVFVLLDEGAEEAEAGVVDEEVDGDATGSEVVVEALGGGRVAQVGGDGRGRDAVLGGEVGGELVQGSTASGDEDQVMAALGEEPGEVEADSAGGAGD